MSDSYLFIFIFQLVNPESLTCSHIIPTLHGKSQKGGGGEVGTRENQKLTFIG